MILWGESTSGRWFPSQRPVTRKTFLVILKQNWEKFDIFKSILIPYMMCATVLYYIKHFVQQAFFRGEASCECQRYETYLYNIHICIYRFTKLLLLLIWTGWGGSDFGGVDYPNMEIKHTIMALALHLEDELFAAVVHAYHIYIYIYAK